MKTIFFAALIALSLCACGTSDQEKAYQHRTQGFYTYLDTMKVGDVFTNFCYENENRAILVEQDEKYTKYRIYDPRINHPDYIYVTLAKGKIIAIWTGRY